MATRPRPGHLSLGAQTVRPTYQLRQVTPRRELAREGKINPASMVTLARSGLAVAVRQGMAKPNISTPEAFKQALLDAKSVSYPDPAEGHAAGILFRSIVEHLGIAQQIAAKAKLQK